MMRKCLNYIFIAFLASLSLFQPRQVNIIDKNVDTLKKAIPDNTGIIFNKIEEIGHLSPAGLYVKTKFYESPSFHRLIFLYTILVIVIAAFLQFLNTFLFKRDLAMIVFLFIVSGIIAAVLSSGYYHPESTGIDERASVALSLHEYWLQWTIRTALTALILQIINLSITKFSITSVYVAGYKIRLTYRLNRAFIILIAIIMLSSAFAVLKTNQYGAKLVPVEEVNLLGKFLIRD
ncbi:MAG TPA: hypothetical protein VHO50_00925 [Bacteroidales bacterium]|nr:hypothetical protein [Bacteroidales bacterium]